jgi:hypothetical protein
MQHD